MSLILLVLVIVLIVRGGDDGGVDPLRDRPFVEVPPEVQLELAEDFRPILLFDSAEPWRPLNIGRFLAEGTTDPALSQQLCQRAAGRGGCSRVRGQGDFVERIAPYRLGGQDLYLDIAGERADGLDYGTPGCDEPPPVRDCNSGAQTAIYYSVIGANGRYYVDYWWFYRFNDFPRLGRAASCSGPVEVLCSDHEGDWEGVTVVVPADDPDEIEYVAYAAHEGTFRYAAPQLELGGRTDQRPFVYVAHGTHASYPHGCEIDDCRQLARTVIRRQEGRYNGESAWGRNTGEACSEPPTCLIPLPAPTAVVGRWNAFAGFWGRVCSAKQPDCPVGNGPRSPSKQQRYLAPWCAHLVAAAGQDFSKRVTCDVATARTGVEAAPGVATSSDCDAWAGSAVSVVACDPDTLARALADDEVADSSTIAIRIDGVNRGQTVTRGVSQVVGEPLRADQDVLIAGRVSKLIVRAREPAGRPPDLVEARFTGIGLEPGEEATLRLRYRDGRVTASLVLPSGARNDPSIVRFQRRGR